MAILLYLLIPWRRGMARSKWERPPTQKGNKKRAADKRKAAKVKGAKASIGFFASLFRRR
jgi:hypothetical protein